MGSAPGVNSWFLQLGGTGSGTALHKEDNAFRSCNINLAGFKIWLLIPRQDYDAFFRIVLETYKQHSVTVPTTGKSQDFCDNVVRHLGLVIAPSLLDRHGVAFRVVVLGPAEGIVTEPDEYHLVYNYGASLSISMNFALPGEPALPPNSCPRTWGRLRW